jgi:hypothetical protein
MALSLKDQIALIYTSAGSMRNVAALIGISHQKVSRILHAGEPGHPQLSDKTLNAPELKAGVKIAFSIHKQITKEQAKTDGIPYNVSLPVFQTRLPLESKNNVPGDRVVAQNTHWLPDEIRNAFTAFMQKSGKFYAASVASIVNIRKYNKRAISSPDTQGARKSIEKHIQQGDTLVKIYTKYTPMNPAFPTNIIIDAINDKLKEKHEPATGIEYPGTALGTEILFQVDTRNGKDKRYRNAHPFPEVSKNRKAAKAATARTTPRKGATDIKRAARAKTGSKKPSKR